MKYRIKFVYMDGKDIEIPLDAERLDSFFKRLNANHIYWADADQKEGFWLNMEKVRFIQFFATEEPKKEEKEVGHREGEASEGQLQEQDECDSAREEDAG